MFGFHPDQYQPDREWQLPTYPPEQPYAPEKVSAVAARCSPFRPPIAVNDRTILSPKTAEILVGGGKPKTEEILVDGGNVLKRSRGGSPPPHDAPTREPSKEASPALSREPSAHSWRTTDSEDEDPFLDTVITAEDPWRRL